MNLSHIIQNLQDLQDLQDLQHNNTIKPPKFNNNTFILLIINDKINTLIRDKKINEIKESEIYLSLPYLQHEEPYEEGYEINRLYNPLCLINLTKIKETISSLDNNQLKFIIQNHNQIIISILK